MYPEDTGAFLMKFRSLAASKGGQTSRGVQDLVWKQELHLPTCHSAVGALDRDTDLTDPLQNPYL